MFLFEAVCASAAAAAKETENDSSLASQRLRQNTHRLETAYQFAQVPSESNQKAALQSLLVGGGFALTPEVTGVGRIPLMMLSSRAALGNPFIGAEALLYEGLLKEFPTFVFFNGGVRLPFFGNNKFVFRRTDIPLGFSTLREIYHLSLSTDLSYVLKLDSNGDPQYGNEWSAMIGGKLESGYHVSPGVQLNYRRAGEYSNGAERLSGRSVFILKPTASYTYDPETLFTGSLAFPLARSRLQEVLKVFGDYTISGLGGATVYLTFEKKF
ncbi:MAG: hypothetical protein HYY61_01200 [Deltaproteobacteria bacterium]|nr:hypothetical protein [Deltaproteobacteria bacterium]